MPRAISSPGTITGLDEQNSQYISRQSKRARLLLWMFVLGLLLTIFFYVAAHLQVQGEAPKALQWVTVSSTSEWQARALDWVLWSLAGTLVFLLLEVANHYPAIWNQSGKATQPPSFEEYTPWYLANLIRGPIIAVVILFFFDAADLRLTGPGDTTGVSFVMKGLDHRVTLLLAFVLGFYSRVARRVLDGIVRSLFGRAWAEAHEEFEIEPAEKVVALGGVTLVRTKPATDVIWAASLGTVDATGKYTAPESGEYAGATVVITAVSKGTYPVAKSTAITLGK